VKAEEPIKFRRRTILSVSAMTLAPEEIQVLAS
jgi:hypothetical protein